MNIRMALAAATAITTLMAASAGHAFTASLWENDPTSDDASIVPAGAPDAMFNTGAVNYDSRVTGYTIAEFLNNPTFFNTSPTFNANDTANNIFIQFSGTVGLLSGDNSFVVEHDDGVVFSIPGIGFNLADGGPTPPTNTPFTVNNPGPAGNYAFTLNYAECCGPPAVLVIGINSVPFGTPEPATWSLMLLGVGAVGGVLRRKTRLAATA